MLVLRDRGNIKWTAMMLPEHVQRLKNWQSELKQIKKPAYDEWTLQALEEEVLQAYYSKKEVIVEVWHDKTSRSFTGIIADLNSEKKKLLIQDQHAFSKNHWVDVDCIIHLEILA